MSQFQSDYKDNKGWPEYRVSVRKMINRAYKVVEGHKTLQNAMDQNNKAEIQNSYNDLRQKDIDRKEDDLKKGKFSLDTIRKLIVADYQNIKRWISLEFHMYVLAVMYEIAQSAFTIHLSA